MLSLSFVYAETSDIDFSPIASSTPIKLDTNHITVPKPITDLEELNRLFYDPTKDNTNSSKSIEQQELKHDIFTPLIEENNSDNSIEEEIKPLATQIDLNQKTETEEIVEDITEEKHEIEEPKKEDDVYYNEISYEGLIISNIEYQGLETISKEFVDSIIKTQINTPYNEDKLQQELQTIYDTGYFSEDISIDQELLYDGTLKLTFLLKENKTINNVIFEGVNVCTKDELKPFVKNLKGKPQNIRLINESIAEIDKYYNEKGYLLGKVAAVDDDEYGNLIFIIHEGIIKNIKIKGNTKTKDFVINRNIVTKVGDVYNEECINEDLQRIFATQIFEEISKSIEEVGENSGEYDISIIVKESKNTNGINIGAGIDSGIGVFGEVGIYDNNFRGRAQRVSLNGLIGSGILLNDSSIKNRINYQAELNFFEPYLFNADNSLASKLYIRELGSYQIPLAIERRIGVNAQLQHKFKNYEHLRGTFDAGVEHINLKEGDGDKISSLYAERGLNFSNRAKQLQGGFFVNLSPGLVYKDVDSDINPRVGTIGEIHVNESLAIGSMKKSSTRLAGSVTKILPVANKSAVYLTAKAGTKLTGSEMPEIFAYRLGGPYNIRGFRNSGVGSGESFLMGSAELATPVFGLDRLKYEILQTMRMHFFMDAGKMYRKTITSELYDRPMGAISIGLGLTIHIPKLGPLTIDYGLPITHVGKYNSQRGYFTFGSSYFGDNW